ncbi:ribosome-associated translation inhibitor RaiA [Clostridium sartagoforme]|uniref:Ribosome hibernation promoting factor n=1 Tax=Clostridium sartagoforme TaxID=84031 RepID=A0A4S2DK09_9CLOT|nr:ribosome-associated translation inhibitor RaiA [Clostridium sartagoforme]MBS5951711.1 ribosome-associated translation inhibitor RaiA [Clostridium sp.]TGY42558.1 ribosome-associated translation inhibitor RaiA [Clostridium sartagoforme]
MRVSVIAKNTTATPALKDMVEKKLSKVDRYFNPEVEAKATLSVQKNKQKVEITIPFNGVVLRAEEATDDMYKSIDLVVAKLERRIRKQKTKLSRRNNESLRFKTFDEVAVEDELIEENGKVVKTKKFGIKPMSVEEAILQMELVGHNFFVFQDADENKIAVVYKRKDGDYGLLEPDYI